MITISLVRACIIPDIYSYVPFVIGAFTIAATTILTIGLPWRRLPARTVLLIPLLDIIAIGLVLGGVPG